MVKEFKRFGVYLVCLDPVIGSEIKKTRPCIIISPEEMNNNLNTVIIAPMTSKVKNYPCRVGLVFNGKKGEVALDQIKAIDKSRIVKYWGKINNIASKKLLNLLQEIFAF